MNKRLNMAIEKVPVYDKRISTFVKTIIALVDVITDNYYFIKKSYL